MYWEHCTSPDIEQMDKNIPVILPIAAIEQHGPHLPLATDKMIGAHFCEQAHLHLKDKVLILPLLSVGCSEHHKDFAGSLSLTHETFLHQMNDIAACVTEYGFKRIVVFNSHGGNLAIAQTFMESFGYRHPEIQLATLTWWKIALEKLKELNESGKGGCGHAGEFETSLMLLIAPELVKMEKAQPRKNNPTFSWAEGDLLYGPEGSLYRTMKEMTSNGVFGDPTFATLEKGKAITEIVVSKLVNILTSFQ